MITITQFRDLYQGLHGVCDPPISLELRPGQFLVTCYSNNASRALSWPNYTPKHKWRIALCPSDCKSMFWSLETDSNSDTIPEDSVRIVCGDEDQIIRDMIYFKMYFQ